MPAASWLIVAWLSVLGAVLGSFINVVVWRVPRGGSLLEPPSQCPKCGHPIRWYDNVPILGWFLLRGRCRDCQAPISARYPLVEAACFGSFMVLAILECGLQGANLPPQRELIGDDILLTTGWSGRELYGIFLFHQALWCTLLVGGLIEYDGLRPGWRVYAPALGAATLAGSSLSLLYPVPAWEGLDGWYAGIVTLAAGLAVGGGLGWLLGRWEPTHRRNGLGFGLACVGAILGWQAAVGLAVLAAMWQIVAATLGRRIAAVGRVPVSLALVALCFVWLAAWANLVQWFPWLG